MKYFTREETLLIVNNNPVSLCNFWDDNPALESMRALNEYIRCSGFPNDRYFIISSAFLLGRAYGVREERARRKKRR